MKIAARRNSASKKKGALVLAHVLVQMEALHRDALRALEAEPNRRPSTNVGVGDRTASAGTTRRRGTATVPSCCRRPFDAGSIQPLLFGQRRQRRPASFNSRYGKRRAWHHTLVAPNGLPHGARSINGRPSAARLRFIIRCCSFLNAETCLAVCSSAQVPGWGTINAVASANGCS